MRARDWAMRCDACGTMNKETSRFCLYCGASLTTAGTEAAPANPDARRAPRRNRDGHVLVLPVPILVAGHERVARRLAGGRGDRGPAVRVHRIGPVLDDPAVATFGRRHLSHAASVSRITAGRG